MGVDFLDIFDICSRKTYKIMYNPYFSLTYNLQLRVCLNEIK